MICNLIVTFTTFSNVNVFLVLAEAENALGKFWNCTCLRNESVPDCNLYPRMKSQAQNKLCFASGDGVRWGMIKLRNNCRKTLNTVKDCSNVNLGSSRESQCTCTINPSIVSTCRISRYTTLIVIRATIWPKVTSDSRGELLKYINCVQQTTSTFQLCYFCFWFLNLWTIYFNLTGTLLKRYYFSLCTNFFLCHKSALFFSEYRPQEM